MKQSNTLLEAFNGHVARLPEKTAFIYLGNGVDETDRLTYAVLQAKALAIAGTLRWSVKRTGPALLIYPPGLDFIAALLGCFYAGVIAVPVPFFAARRARDRIISIASHCGPSVVLTTNRIFDQRIEGIESLESPWIATDVNNKVPRSTAHPIPAASDIALIQYSSGSTGAPKGVVISHANLAHNQNMMVDLFGHNEKSIGVNWVPPYHDMGLIGAVLQTLYCGGTSILLPPLRVLQQPIFWLRAISRYRGNTSTAPAFAYEACSRLIPPKERSRLDLRSWEVAICGGEQVRAEVLQQFAEDFAEAGFSANSFVPAFGLAEATLLVTSSRKGEGFRTRFVDSVQSPTQAGVAAPPAGPPRSLVCCGTPHHRQRIAIVEPETRQLLPEGVVGEIWVAGDSVAQGYWRESKATQENFAAHLATDDGINYLRTGDLGFISREGLYVTGRRKEILIVRGQNHYPQDIENAVLHSHITLTRGLSVAFGIEVAGEEKVVVAFEPSRKDYKRADITIVTEAAVAEVSRGFGIKLHDFVWVRPGSLPRTTSGKVQRGRCRELYLAGELPLVSSN